MWRCQQTEYIGVTCSTEKSTGKGQERMCVLVTCESWIPSASPKAVQRAVQGMGHLRAFLPWQDNLLWPRLGNLFWEQIKTSEACAVISLIIQGDCSSMPDPAALEQLNVGSCFLSHGYCKAGPRLLLCCECCIGGHKGPGIWKHKAGKWWEQGGSNTDTSWCPL